MKYISIIFLLLLSNSGFSCDCIRIKDLAEAQRQSYSDSDLVILGEVVSSNPEKGEYELKILELFKGNYKQKVLKGKSVGYCSLFPMKEDGLWLAYANMLPDGSIFISDCGLSRSYRFLYAFNNEIQVFPPPPPPPMMDAVLDELNWELEVIDYRRKALIALKKEIEQLRKWNNLCITK